MVKDRSRSEPYIFTLFGGEGGLTNIDLQTPATAWQAGEVGKSMGKFGRPRIETRGSRPFWFTNSWQWSSVVLLLRMDSTNFIWRGQKGKKKTQKDRQRERERERVCVCELVNPEIYVFARSFNLASMEDWCDFSTVVTLRVLAEHSPHSKYNPWGEWGSSPQYQPLCESKTHATHGQHFPHKRKGTQLSHSTTDYSTSDIQRAPVHTNATRRNVN